MHIYLFVKVNENFHTITLLRRTRYDTQIIKGFVTRDESTERMEVHVSRSTYTE